VSAFNIDFAAASLALLALGAVYVTMSLTANLKRPHPRARRRLLAALDAAASLPWPTSASTAGALQNPVFCWRSCCR